MQIGVCLNMAETPYSSGILTIACANVLSLSVAILNAATTSRRQGLHGGMMRHSGLAIFRISSILFDGLFQTRCRPKMVWRLALTFPFRLGR